MSRFLGEIRQLGYVVEDIEAGIKYWTEVMGVGPWYYNSHVPIKNYEFCGQPYEIHNSVALANSGNVQVELIQTRDDTPSMYKEFKASNIAGLQHVAFWTSTFDADLQKMFELNYQVKMSGEVGTNGRFVYFNKEYHPGTVIELSEVLGPKGELFRIIRESAVDWDGSDPLRPFPDLSSLVIRD